MFHNKNNRIIIAGFEKTFNFHSKDILLNHRDHVKLIYHRNIRKTYRRKHDFFILISELNLFKLQIDYVLELIVNSSSRKFMIAMPERMNCTESIIILDNSGRQYSLQGSEFLEFLDRVLYLCCRSE